MSPKEMFEDIRSFCIANRNEDNVKKYSKYFKEGYDAYGVQDKLTRAKADEILAKKDIDLNYVLELGRILINTGKYEEGVFAYLLVKKFLKQYQKETFAEIGNWFETGIRNWAHSDVFCGEVLSPFLIKSIVKMDDFSGWRISSNKFKRRAVPVAFIKYMKKSSDFQPFFDFLDPMMMDKEREVHQGLGWFLREAWKKQPEATEQFLLKWKDSAARLIFQYATEKMTPEDKARFRREKTKI